MIMVNRYINIGLFVIEVNDDKDRESIKGL
jgi:hypothetical protein